MSAEIVGRVLQRTKELGLSPRAASLAAGMGADAIRDMVRKPGMSPTMETLEKLAGGLQTTARWLAFGEAEDPSSNLVVSSPRRRFVRPLYGGVVEAGSFREANDFDDDPERTMPSEEVDDRFPDVPLISFTVAGDSMNDLKPTAILPGQRVIGLDFEGLRNRVPFRDGMVVVVEQTLNGGHLRERSVKQIELHRDRTEFCPRSTNPKHKPIVVPFDMVEQGDEDGRQVTVIAIVRRVIHDLPDW